MILPALYNQPRPKGSRGQGRNFLQYHKSRHSKWCLLNEWFGAMTKEQRNFWVDHSEHWVCSTSLYLIHSSRKITNTYCGRKTREKTKNTKKCQKCAFKPISRNYKCGKRAFELTSEHKDTKNTLSNKLAKYGNDKNVLVNWINI